MPHSLGNASTLVLPGLPQRGDLTTVIPREVMGLFQQVPSSHQVAKVLELQLQDQSFQCIFRLISFRIDWFDLFAGQGTLRSLLQHHSLKA